MNTEDCIGHLDEHLDIGGSTNSYIRKLGLCVKNENHNKILVTILGEHLYTFPHNLDYLQCLYISSIICDKYDISLLPLTFKDWFRYTSEWIKFKKKTTFSIKYKRRYSKWRKDKRNIYYIFVQSQDDLSYRKYGSINDVMACNYLYSLAIKNLSTHKKIKTISSNKIV